MGADEDLHADHFEQPHAADPDAIPDALSHGRCNTYAGRVLQLLIGGHVAPPHWDEQLETVRRQVLSQAQGFDLGAMAAAAGRGPTTRQSREW
jgi:hypothetical protein